MIDCIIRITFVSFEVASARLAYFHIQYIDMPTIFGTKIKKIKLIIRT